jgi:hypothetical protein
MDIWSWLIPTAVSVTVLGLNEARMNRKSEVDTNDRISERGEGVREWVERQNFVTRNEFIGAMQANEALHAARHTDNLRRMDSAEKRQEDNGLKLDKITNLLMQRGRPERPTRP